MRPAARFVLITAVGLTTLVLAVVFASRFGTDPRLSPSPLIGAPAPDISLDLVDIEGSLRLEDLAGDIVVVNFWAPWCVPCRTEHPVLIELAQGFAGFGVTVVGAAYQSQEDDVIAYLDELGRGYPIGMDEQSRAAIGFGVRGVPETYFVDRDGVVVAKVSGPINLALAAATLDNIILGKPVDSVTTGDTNTAP